MVEHNEVGGFFSAVIRDARVRAGMSQDELANACGVSQPAVALWERGVRPLLETTLEKVAAGLGMTIGSLLYPHAREAWITDQRHRRKKKRGGSHATARP